MIEWLLLVTDPKPCLQFQDYQNESEEDEVFLSDDDNLDNNDNQGLLDSLRSGALPPELR